MSKTLIIHGWSDCAKSFGDLKALLVDRRVTANPNDIYFVSYESQEDDLTFDLVVRLLDNRLKQKGLIAPDGARIEDLNVIVHSTGALVVRDWLATFYGQGRTPGRGECPVKRLVMLAPANFGSPLAHRGKSFLGALVKGRKTLKLGDLLEVGDQILDGLELASAYQWDLTHRDVFDPQSALVSGGIQTTVLVGAEEYPGLKGTLTSKPGTDGTVVISGTSLNAAKMVVDYTRAGVDATAPLAQAVSLSQTGTCGFAVLPGLNHGTIVTNLTPQGSQIADLVCEALNCSDTQTHKSFCDKLTAVTADTYSGADGTTRGRYQQFVFRAYAYLGSTREPVTDYHVEFFVVRRDTCKPAGTREIGEIMASRLQGREASLTAAVAQAMQEWHTNKKDPSLRRLLVDCDALEQVYARAEAAWGQGNFLLGGRIHIPETRDGVTFDTEDLRAVVIHDPSHPARTSADLFRANVTTMVELRVRQYSDWVRVELEPAR